MEFAPEHRSLESVPVAICVVKGPLLVYANPSWAELFRIPRESVIGRDVSGLLGRMVGGDDQRWIQELHQRGLEGQPRTQKLWVRLQFEHSQVSMIQVRGEAGPREGESLFVIMPAESEAMLLEFTESLSAGAARLMRCRTEEAVLEGAVDILFENGLAAATLFPDGENFRQGPLRQPPELIAFAEKVHGKPVHEVRFPRKLLPLVDEVIRGGKAIFHHEFLEIVRPIHPPRIMQALSALPKVRAVDAPLFVEGRAIGIIAAIGPQLTPAMAAAVELFARHVGAAIENARHHALVAQQLHTVKSLQSELLAQERLAVLGAAAGVLAHEVRNPLAAMLNGVAILRRDHVLSEDGQRVLTMVDEESRRLERLVHDLLDFTRPLEPRRTSVELTEVPRRAVALLKERNEDQGLTIDFEATAGSHLIHADAHLLGLAVENLLRNAVQASPEGGRVRMLVEKSADAELLIVEDEGAGVPDTDRSRIFEPFFTTRAKGSGLGLPIVLRIAKAHGGNVTVCSAASGGARFELSLPKL